jgi:hypothetical protein
MLYHSLPQPPTMAPIPKGGGGRFGSGGGSSDGHHTPLSPTTKLILKIMLGTIWVPLVLFILYLIYRSERRSAANKAFLKAHSFQLRSYTPPTGVPVDGPLQVDPRHRPLNLAPAKFSWTMYQERRIKRKAQRDLNGQAKGQAP